MYRVEVARSRSYDLQLKNISDNDDPVDVSYRTKVLDIYPPCPANFDPAATKEVFTLLLT